MPFAFHSVVCFFTNKIGNEYICTNILHTGESNCVGRIFIRGIVRYKACVLFILIEDLGIVYK